MLKRQQVDVGGSIGIASSCSTATIHTHFCATLIIPRPTPGQHGRDLRHAFHSHPKGYLSLLGELRRAVAEGELILHYQPKVDVRAGRAAHVEALVRRQHPERGLIHRDVGQHAARDLLSQEFAGRAGIPSFTTLASAGV